MFPILVEPSSGLFELGSYENKKSVALYIKVKGQKLFGHQAFCYQCVSQK